MPFRIQTYSPVTKSKIESLAMGNGTQKLLQKNRDELLLLLNGANGECYHFDDKNVRIYIVDDKDRYYIDKGGVVSFDTQDNAKCLKSKIDENSIEKLLLEGNVDFWKNAENK
ncbi:hypothetical protein SMW60_004890 [Escherichia albertii]|nr:hypothetical protein [Escherichia albertii]EJM0810283.1 hypothetical protein [Escherichia albertii]EJM1766704.1 hypothetical protein [Escherichia albertii]EJM2115077.1 hypothetical protein [Escherichia albertii]EJO0116973.1 hypothetical protein [Escherichia albertii]